MDTARPLLGDPPARGDALASALGALGAFTALVAIVDGVAAVALTAGAIMLLVLAAGAAYRGGGLPAALALAVLPAAGWYLGPLLAGERLGLPNVLLGLGIAVVLGAVGFALGAGTRAAVGS